MKDYQTLLVGAQKNNTFENDYLKDNEGENISYKNDSYCELTGMYWIWKNRTDDAVGIVHYRRFFAHVDYLVSFRGRYISLKKNPYRICTSDHLFEQLKDVDIVVKQSEYRKSTLEEIFVKLLGVDIWNNFRDTVYEMYPDYIDAFNATKNAHRHFNCNMCITSKQNYDRYCEFLFSIVDKMDENHMQLTGDRYHNRELGYFGEFILGMWITKNELTYKTCDVVNIESKELVGSVLSPLEFINFLINKSKRGNN